MTDTSTQAVVDETKGAAQPAPVVENAREDDLDTVLAQFDQGTKTTRPETQPAPTQAAAPDNSALQGRVAELERTINTDRFQRDITPVIKAVRGDIDPATYDDEDVRDWIDRQARNDPRIQTAWQNRDTDKAGFEKVVKGLQRKLAQRFEKQPDKGATEDRAAVAAAVRGASTRTPDDPPPKYGEMSDAQFRKELDKLGM